MQSTAAGRAARAFTALLILGGFLVACGDSTDPPAPVATVELSPANDTVIIGQTSQLDATLKDASGNTLHGRTVTWVSGSTTVASVSATGLVTGVADGTATITATSESKSGTASIRVLSRCSTVLASTITVGQTVNGSLAVSDCKLPDNTYADGYRITVTAATNVQIDMTASFDTYLALVELLPNGTLVDRAVNDDISDADTNSRITFTLQPNLA